jgi:hypothetical protein
VDDPGAAGKSASSSFPPSKAQRGNPTPNTTVEAGAGFSLTRSALAGMTG